MLKGAFQVCAHTMRADKLGLGETNIQEKPSRGTARLALQEFSSSGLNKELEQQQVGGQQENQRAVIYQSESAAGALARGHSFGQSSVTGLLFLLEGDSTVNTCSEALPSSAGPASVEAVWMLSILLVREASSAPPFSSVLLKATYIGLA